MLDSKPIRSVFALTIVFILSLIFSFATSAQDSTNWWNETIFYEIFVRSFKDSDGDGDGDFKGLIEKLDYLNDGDPTTNTDLGITGIWLMPICQSPSYHGYDVTDYRTIEKDYGTNEDFKLFMEEAHKRGIKVIVDYVMNHSSTAHPWFQASLDENSEYRDWYRWTDTRPDIKGPWNQTVWHTRAGAYYYGLFWNGMPDLNYESDTVKSMMFDNARFWLEEMGVDGFRLDAIKYIMEDGDVLEDTETTHDFWRDFRAYYKSIDENALAIGEAWTTTSKIVPYVEDGGLDMCFDFDLAEYILYVINNQNGTRLKNQLQKVVDSYPHLQYATFLTNHDQNRLMDMLGDSPEKAKLAANILMTLPGVPFMYYGEEIGMNGSKPDENIRKPMQWDASANGGFSDGSPWRATNLDFPTKNVAAQQQDRNSLWNNYRQMITLRNQHSALRTGDFQTLNTANNGLVAYQRSNNEQQLAVIHNVKDEVIADVEIDLVIKNPGTYVLVDLLGGGQVEVATSTVDQEVAITIPQMEARSTAVYVLTSADALSQDVAFELDLRPLLAQQEYALEDLEVKLVVEGVAPTYSFSDDNQDSVFTGQSLTSSAGQAITYHYEVLNTKGAVVGTTDTFTWLVQAAHNNVSDVYQMPVSLGVKDVASVELEVYPQPATEYLIVNSAASDIQLIDGLGKAVPVQFSRTASSTRIDVQSLSPGMYLLSVEGMTQPVVVE